LKAQFRERTPERVYLAVVYGHPMPESGTWHNHLVWDKKALIQKETSPRDAKLRIKGMPYSRCSRSNSSAFAGIPIRRWS